VALLTLSRIFSSFIAKLFFNRTFERAILDLASIGISFLSVLLFIAYFPHISNGISGEFPGRVLSLSGASAPVVNLHVHISFSLAFPDKP
jgi:hypothetical protein